MLALLTLALGPVVYTAQQGIAPDDLAAFARYKRFTTYDQHFTKYSKRFFGVGFDWHYFKAQAVAESNLREDARSPVGAVGLMQITPQTAEELGLRNRRDPVQNIMSAAKYINYLRKLVPDQAHEPDLTYFALAAYNIGIGHLGDVV